MSAKNITVITLCGKEVHRTRNKANQLAAKGNHIWRGEYTLVEVVPNSTHPDYARLQLPGHLPARVRREVRPVYIPEKMPPREVPGVFFQEPQSATWREQHRLVRFL